MSRLARSRPAIPHEYRRGMPARPRRPPQPRCRVKASPTNASISLRSGHLRNAVGTSPYLLWNARVTLPLSSVVFRTLASRLMGRSCVFCHGSFIKRPRVPLIWATRSPSTTSSVRGTHQTKAQWVTSPDLLHTKKSAPCRIRTCDLVLRRHPLWSTELRGQQRGL
jgi:hypothetical protein